MVLLHRVRLKNADERRILITQWLAKAWQTRNTDYPENSKSLFQKTVLVVTAKSSDDKLIQSEGFEDYTFENSRNNVDNPVAN